MPQAFITYNQSNDRIKTIHTYQTIFYKRMGPQQREFHWEIQQAKQVGDGPQQREFHWEIQQAKQVGDGAPTKRISL